jgi:cellulose biosynthesis protein BcsQ
MSGTFPATDKIIEISRITGVSIHWLLTGEGEKSPEKLSKRPLTLMFTGYKSSVGTTMTACYIAFILANKGYKVLFVGHEHSPEDLMTVTDENVMSLKTHAAATNIYTDTNLPGVHFFRKEGMSYPDALKSRVKPFYETETLTKESYDFIICDAPSGENPFRSINMPFNEFLSNAKVIIPYEIWRSEITDIKRVTQFINAERSLGYHAEFLGLFISKENAVLKNRGIDKESIEELRNFVGEKMLKSSVRKDETWFGFDFSSPISRKTEKSKLFIDCLALTEEILTKIESKV